LADDERAVREALSEALRQAGYQVVTAANGQEALEHARRDPRPTLIILDLVMPVMDGFAFLEQRGRDPSLRSIPVIAISGQPDLEERARAAQASYIYKPLLGERLFETLDRMVN
jgi:CheY-like chemotaxis protein